MKSTFVISALTALSGTLAANGEWYTGWNLPSNNRDATCKRPIDWAADFQYINRVFKPQYLAGRTAVKIFNAAQCDTAANVVGPAIKANMKVLIGLGARENNGEFAREKAALNSAIKAHGCDWLVAVSVGSEELYRKEVTPERMAAQLQDVRGLVRQYPGSCKTIPIAHSDTTGAWMDKANAPVVQASDIIIHNAYVYWEGADIAVAQSHLAGAIGAVNNAVGGKEAWIGETGWPTAGATNKQAVPSIANARRYWELMKCPTMGGPLYGTSSFWYGAFDQPFRSSGVEQNFGVATAQREMKYSLGC